MTLIIGLFGAIIGTLVGGIATYATTRSSLRLTLEHSYDQTLQGKRLERYQELFHITKSLPRYWPPGEQEPTQDDLRRFMRSFHDWYFGKDAGGMFLTVAAKGSYLRLLNLLAEIAYSSAAGLDNVADRRLSATESQKLRRLASELRHQLTEDVGAANPPRLRWTRPHPQSPPPEISP